MNAALQKCSPKTCAALHSVIGSLEYLAGVLLSSLPGGQSMSPSGQEAVLVNRSQSPEKDKAKPTIAISGQPGSTSSASAGHKPSSASKSHPQKLSALSLRLLSLSRFRQVSLPELTNSPSISHGQSHFTTVIAGSLEYVQTWQARVTPCGLKYWEHTARGRRISDSGFTGWPSPKAKDGREWSPNAKAESASGHGLGAIAQKTVAGWSTPNTMEGGQTSRSGKRKGELLMGGLVGWPTPTKSMVTEQDLAQAMTAGNSKDRKTYAESTILGTTSNSSPAQTGKPGVSPALNPGFSLYLMGFPAEWLCSGVLAMQSAPKSPRSSSKLT